MGELNHPTTDHEPHTYQRHSALKKKWQHHSEHKSTAFSLAQDPSRRLGALQGTTGPPMPVSWDAGQQGPIRTIRG